MENSDELMTAKGWYTLPPCNYGFCELCRRDQGVYEIAGLSNGSTWLCIDHLQIEIESKLARFKPQNCQGCESLLMFPDLYQKKRVPILCPKCVSSVWYEARSTQIAQDWIDWLDKEMEEVKQLITKSEEGGEND